MKRQWLFKPFDRETTYLLDLLRGVGATLLDMAHLATSSALGNVSVLREAGVAKTFKVLLRSLRPGLGAYLAARLGARLEGDDVLAVDIALQVDVGVNVRGRTGLLGDEVSREALLAEAVLEIDESQLRNKLRIREEVGLEVVNIASLVSLDELLPALVGVGELGEIRRINVVLLVAVGDRVAHVATLLASLSRALGTTVTL